jgi:hypothetical protein
MTEDEIQVVLKALLAGTGLFDGNWDLQRIRTGIP